MRGILYYDTKYGSTALIAQWIQEEIKRGIVDIVKIDEYLEIDENYDFIILGTPIFIGKPTQCFINFVKNNKDRFGNNIFLFIISWASATIYSEKSKEFIELIEFYLQPHIPLLTASLPGKLYLNNVSKRDSKSMKRILRRLDHLSDEFYSKDIIFNNQMDEQRSREFGRKINDWISCEFGDDNGVL